jgi:Fur family transcriptional regulator, iron response regulator
MAEALLGWAFLLQKTDNLASQAFATELQLGGTVVYERGRCRPLSGCLGVSMNQPRPLGFPSRPVAAPAREKAELNGCPWHDVKAMLRKVGLRPTRQRMALGWLLFGRGDRHLTAEMLYEEASRAKVPVSLATIYNTLHQFTQVGLLRQLAVEGSKAYFDTNTSSHHHFFIEGPDRLIDIAGDEVQVGKTPVPPEGFEIARVDVVVRLRKKS